MSDGSSFDDTRWPRVLALGRQDEEGYRRAVESLVQDYWRPIYAFFRRRTEPDRAEDLTQAFFAHLLEARPFRGLKTPHGSFRGYLKKALRTFAIDQHRHDSARRRSPRGGLVSLDGLEGRLGGLVAGDDDPPEVEFDRQWVRQVFRLARERMAERYRSQGREVAFEVFRRFVLEPGASHRELAEEYGLSPSQVNNHVSRGKASFERILREVVADSVSSAEAVGSEMDELFRDL